MSLVKSFTHLKGRPKEEQALPQLQRVASLVKPIMRKHDWTLPVLAEFFPKNDSLVGMNVNRGQKILLRLRPAYALDTFYEEEQLVLVMLHELTHNVHGPHDSKFYALLSKLEQEYEDLKRSGYAGEGFHSVGARLGVGVSHDLPPHLAKLKALDAAEKRRKTSVVLGAGGKLGGGAAGRGKSPRQLAAEAAERRAKDEKSCAAGHGVEAEMEAERAANDSVVDVIDVDALEPIPTTKRDPSPELIIFDGPSQPARKRTGEPPQKKRILDAKLSRPIASSSEPLSKASSEPTRRSYPSSRPKARLKALPSSDEWSCLACTLINAPLALQCSACFASRPPDPGAGWTCLACGEEGMQIDFWTCRSCGRMKSES